MLKTKKAKLLLVLTIVITLLFPYTAPVLAVNPPTKQHSSYQVGDTEKFYPTTSFENNKDVAYSMHTVMYDYLGDGNPIENIVLQIAENSYDYTNALFCVDLVTAFTQRKSERHKNVGDMYVLNANRTQEVKDYVNQIGEANYNSLMWLANNIYLEHYDNDQESDYNKFLNEVYADYIAVKNVDLNTIKTGLGRTSDKKTDKDIVRLIEQLAVWYFTNNKNDYISFILNPEVNSANGYKYNEAQNKFEVAVENPNIAAEDTELTGTQKELFDIMLSYLIIKANTNNSAFTVKDYPEFEKTNPQVKVEGDKFLVGLFKIKGTNPVDYDVEVVNGNNAVITNYVVKNNTTTFDNIKATLGNEFYIEVPASDNLTYSLKLKYKENTTEATLWERLNENGEIDFTVDNNGNKVLNQQPVMWVTRTTKTPAPITAKLEKGDLALRKYIVKIGDTEVTDRTPKVDATALIETDPAKHKDTAEYKHKKSPVEVSAGDLVTYEIRVYNESNIDANTVEIKDIIPNGFEFVKDNEINSKWSYDEEKNIASIVINEKLSKVDAEKIKNNKNTIDGGLSSTSVQIVLRVKSKENLTDKSEFTNVADIVNSNIIDRDSDNDSMKRESLDLNNHTGDKNNKDDLNDSNYHYKGFQDDDDFEKVKIKVEEKKKSFDLALMKYITRINGKEITDRVPKVNVDPLKKGGNDATYTTNKSKLTVQQGDIVTYTIRVYNEGEQDGYAEEIADYIPEGLGFIVSYKTNYDNNWKINKDDASKVDIKLKDIPNALSNVKLTDFTSDVKSLDDVMVLKGKSKITTDLLNSTVKSNILKGFDTENGKSLDSKTVEVTCVVLSDKASEINLRNIAEIEKHSSTNDGGETTNPNVVDRDSVPGTVNQDKYPGDDVNQDDNDIENLTIVEEEKVYDLALQKFITGVDGKAIIDRTPTLKLENGKIVYNHTKNPLEVANNQLVEYTIRVYNEGKSDAYAAEVEDNLPKGLIYVAENQTNKTYGWELYDKNGKVTTDVTQAVKVKTKYLSKEESEKRKENNLLKGFDSSKAVGDANPDYRDLKIVFRVSDKEIDKTKSVEARIIKNIAEISRETDDEGNEVKDEDSIPGNGDENEDDIDIEKVYVKYFDLALKKNLIKVLVIENGETTEYDINDDQLFKVEIHKKKLNSVTVKFVYQIIITNEGEIEGFASEIKDYIPEGLKFLPEDNKGWYEVSEGIIATDMLAKTLLHTNESAAVNVTLTWINGEDNLGKKVNVAEISKDYNEYDSSDIDSTPDNRIPDEDDIDNAPVLLGISTGSEPTYFGVIAAVVVIVATGVVLIKKYVL